MKRHWKIFLLTGIALLAVIVLALQLYESSKKVVLSQFRDEQFIHAQHLSIQIESFFLHHTWRLQELSALILPRYTDHKWKNVYTRDHLQFFHKKLEKAQVKGIFLQDETGTIIHATNRDWAALIEGQSGFLSWAKKWENRGAIFVSPLSQTQPLQFLLAIPLYQEEQKPPRSKEMFIGTLSLIVDLKQFLSDQIGMAEPNRGLHELWIIDKGGTLLFHSLHSDMAQRNIFKKDESCTQCHSSFAHAEKILNDDHGFSEYRATNGQEKVAAFVPLKFENASWIIVVNSPFDRVTAFAWKGLRGYMVLLGIVMAALIGGSTWIVRNDRLKVKAEEEARHWREKQSLEDRVRQSELLYRTIVETAHDSIWMTDREGKLTFLNKQEGITGYPASELIGKSLALFVHPDDLTKGREAFQRILQGHSYSDEIRVVRRDGKILRVSVNTVPLYEEGTIIGTVSVGRDITEQKQAEEALRESEKQLRHLSSQILTAQETERRRISRELHDELGQALTLMKIRLRSIETELGKKQAGMREECQNILQYIDQIIENVRRLSRDLSPSILEDLGLTASLRWLINNFVRNDSIQVSQDITSVDDLFPQDRQIIIYRILQEALNNIGKHAQAKNVSIAIQKYDGRVSFCIQDDGEGFDLSRAATKEPNERGLGLAIMDERARMLGGSLEIWSQQGKGTRITLNVSIDHGGNP